MESKEMRNRHSDRASAAVQDVPALRSLRVLIVDDDQDTADSLSRLISSWGHDARGAYDGAACLELAAAHAPEVVLLAVAMLGMDGYELAQQLRLDARLKKCYLIAMKEKADAWGHEHCLESDFDLFLAKPVDRAVLRDLLSLEGRRLGPSRAQRGIKQAWNKTQP
jgi:CheY-like chemotaxis protein